MARTTTNGASKRNPLSAGLIGIGHRGYNTHFLANLEETRSWKISAVCDVNEETRSGFTNKNPYIPTYPSLDELLDNHVLDFAIVCVPHRDHLELCTKLANAGVPILKEKPVALSWEEYCQLLRLPVKIGVTFQKRFEPRYVALRNLLPQVGQVASFRATLASNIADLDKTWRAEHAVGVTEDLGCHMLDIVVDLFGKPTSVTAQNAKGVRRHQEYGGDDVSNIIMNFGKDFAVNTGLIHLSRVSHRAEESLIITGTEGTLILEDKEVTMKDVSGNETFLLRDTSSKRYAVKTMVQSFADWISGEAVTFSTSIANLEGIVTVSAGLSRSIHSLDTAQHLDTGSIPQLESSLQGNHHVWPLIYPETEAAVVDQMHSSLSIYNRSDIYEVFEDRWRHMHGLKHALVCSSGTVAIYHMFEALDLRPGDEILCPVYTFFATASPMLQFGAVPVFCDSLPDGNMDPAEIERRCTIKTRAVIVTHMWGLPCRMQEIVDQAASVNGGIKVLEDCSHAHGASVDGRLVGSWGDMAAWSLQAKKNISGGQAGVMATNSTDYYSRAILHGHFNKRAKQEVPEDHPLRKFWLTGLGLNLRAHPLSIALANQQLNLYQLQDHHRQIYAAYITSALSAIPFLKMPDLPDGKRAKHAYYALVIQFDPSAAPSGMTRESFVARLVARGLSEVDIPRSTGLLNGLPLFQEPHAAIPRFGDGPWYAPQPASEFPIADAFYMGAIKLPVWATEGDRPIVEHYVRTFLAVAEEVSGVGQGERIMARQNGGCPGLGEIDGVARGKTNGAFNCIDNGQSNGHGH